MSRRTPLQLVEPFKVALNGLVYTFKTQRHMRFHIYVVIVVLLMGIWMNIGHRELLAFLLTISLVIVAEMFNSAIEATVDLISPNYHPLAKFAKDISAGAVLITTIIAFVVGALVILGENRWEAVKTSLTAEGFGPTAITRLIIGGLMLFLVVVIGKALGQRGQVLQGGLVSGHAAYGFFFATSTAFVTDNALATGIAIVLAVIIAQSRFEAKFHSIFELSLGAVVGVMVSVAVFSLVPR
ncbi:diacylglycerol kinase [soil metagenome]